MLFVYDYIYCVDLLAYVKNEDKEVILRGEETKAYKIHPNHGLPLSLKKQRAYLNKFDIDYFLALSSNEGNYKEFALYVVDNEKRALIEKYIKAITEQPHSGNPKK